MRPQMKWSKHSRGADQRGRSPQAAAPMNVYACLTRRPAVRRTNLLQKIGRPGMAAVERQYLLKQPLGFASALHSSQSLRAEKQRLDSIAPDKRSEEHTSELQSLRHLV